MIGVIYPSRGLVFSQSAQEMLDNLKDIPHKIFFSHKRPIPECFTEPTEKALKDKEITHLWYIEDDTVLPPNTLKQMLDMDANVVTCDYPITKEGKGSVFYDNARNVIFCGTGCLLVKREVFASLKKPYFTDKIRWSILNYGGGTIKLVGSKNPTGEGYGMHDITFCLKLWKQGIDIKVAPVELGQRKLIALGKQGTNDGAHNIEIWDKIVKDMRLKELFSQPVATGAKSKLVTVNTPTGQVQASQRHAGLLVGKGLATYPTKRYLILDDGAVTL